MKINNSKHPELKIDGKKLKIAILLPYFNDILGQELLENVKEELLKNRVEEKNIKLYRTGGSIELPYAAMRIAEKSKVDCIIALGVILKGATDHYNYVCETTYNGLLQVQLSRKIPIIFGILTCANIKQAKERIKKNGLNKGKEIALAALLQTQLP